MWCDLILPVGVCGCVHVAREFKDRFVRDYLMQGRQSVLVDQIGADAAVEELPRWKKNMSKPGSVTHWAKLWSGCALALQTQPLKTTANSTTKSLDHQVTE